MGHATLMPQTADQDKGTIDCVWYGGQWVNRRDPETGDPYLLHLSISGARLSRLNAGAPIFDTHFSGDDLRSLMANKAGTNAQLGVVEKAWRDAPKGLATLRFDTATPAGAEMFRKASTGIVRHLSFGAWIYKREECSAEGLPAGVPPCPNPGGVRMFVATDWEPFEISTVGVPADFSTTFLSAGGRRGARSVLEIHVVAEVAAGETFAPLPSPPLHTSANETEEIRALGKIAGVGENFVAGLIKAGVGLDGARRQIMTEVMLAGQRDCLGKSFPITEHVSITRDGTATRFAGMECALLLRYDPKFGESRKVNAAGERTQEVASGFGSGYQAQLEALGREFRGMSLVEMARECLRIQGINPRRMSRPAVVQRAMEARAEHFIGAEGTSDFPSILANVANKTLRQGYEAYPRTFQPLARQVTAADFKLINRVQLSDAPALQLINESGEFHRGRLTDSNQSYSLATFGEVVSITRNAIINDDLQAFTRVPAILGVAAARLESDVVWAVIIGNQIMLEDGLPLFDPAHNNLFTGSASSLITNALGALATSRAALRVQQAPQGTPLNLVPRFIIVPAALETNALQAIYPIDIASADMTKVVPEWVRSLIPVVEPRLDAASETAWYTSADPAQIDTVEYCYLEGQEGVYMETRQGFEVDGIEIKARLDFGAAAIDFRGLQMNAGG